MTPKDNIKAMADVLIIQRVVPKQGVRNNLGNRVIYCTDGKDAYAVLHTSDCSYTYRKDFYATNPEERLASTCRKHKLQMLGKVKYLLYADTDKLRMGLDTLCNDAILEAAIRLAKHKNCGLYIMKDQIIEIPEVFSADSGRRFKLSMDTVFELFPVLELS